MSPAPYETQQIQTTKVDIVGGNTFGRYPKISDSQTFNFIVGDDFLVPYAGYKNVLTLNPDLPGRGIYTASNNALMICIFGSAVYAITENNNDIYSYAFIGNLNTSVGDVFISENNNKQIAITDKSNLYVFNYSNYPVSFSFLISGTDFTIPFTSPGYISFQNGRLIIAATGTNSWYLSGFNDATSWTADPNRVGSLQTKPDIMQACAPVPGGGNALLVFGRTVVELWQDIGAALFPYQRASTFNVDYGCINANTIAYLDNYVVWMAINEEAGVTLMVYRGNSAESISTDGMDFKFSKLTNPSNCIGFLFRQAGHVIYQFTFPDNNLSYCYDFRSKLFFTVTDENLNYHIAKNVVLFNHNYYFVSMNGGNLYEFDPKYTNFDYGDGNIQQIPRIRVTSPFRLPSQRFFIVQSLGFTIENGQPNTGAPETPSEVVDLAISRDGGETFGSFIRIPMNASGKRKSRFIFQRLGRVNDFTAMVRFSGFGRFVCTDGELKWYE